MIATTIPAGLPAKCSIKVLVDGRSHHGGELAWSLPVSLADDAGHMPGEWHEVQCVPVLCQQGLHLTMAPGAWWSQKAVAYWCEYDGAVDGPRQGDDRDATKIAVERARLVRPLTRTELEAFGIFQTGEHEVRDGLAWATGSATVRATGSATVRATGSATVTAYDSATVRATGSATVTATGSATVRATGSATVRASA